MKYRTFNLKGMIGLSTLLCVTLLSGCNDQKETFEQALQKEIDRRIEAGELAYPTEEDVTEVSESLGGEEENPIAYNMHGEQVPIDGEDVIKVDNYTIRYRLGDIYEPGEYVIVPNEGEDAYYSVSMDKEGQVIVTNGDSSTYYVMDTLDGAYLELYGCKAYPINEAPKPPKTTDGAYPESRYKVGVQIPAGEYVVKGNAPSATILGDLIGDYDSTLGYFSNTKSAIVSVKEGEYLESKYGDIYPIELTKDLQPSDGIYKDGMYKVGFHMPAGTYVLKADVDTAYVEIYDHVDVDGTKVEDLKAEPEITFTVKEGQYVSIIGGQATLQN